MPGVIVDTDVAIDFLRGESYAQPLLAGLWRAGTAVLSALTVYELTAGMREKEQLPTMVFIDACTIEPVTRRILARKPTFTPPRPGTASAGFSTGIFDSLSTCWIEA